MSNALENQVGGSHYKDMAIQPMEYAVRNNLGPCETLCLRYISRHKRKHGRVDIEKAIHCLEMLLEMEYPLTEPTVFKVTIPEGDFQ